MRKINRRLVLGTTLALSFALAGCGFSGSKQTQAKSEWPSWYQVYDADENYYLGFGEGHSTHLNMATSQARLAAQTELAQSVNSRVQAMVQQGAQQSLDDPQVRGVFEAAQRSLVDTRIADAEADQVHRVRQEDGSVRVYMRVRMPRDEVDNSGRAVLDEMSSRLRWSIN